MEDLKLYNWYGDEHKILVPELSKSLKSYKHFAKVKMQRMLKELNFQKKVNQDLFLRTKTKLDSNLKRELYSHKVAYINKIKVLKETYKKLSFSDSFEKFIAYEIKKLKQKKKKLIKYSLDYQNSLTNTTDSIKQKELLIENLKFNTLNEEIKLFQKYAILNASVIWYKKFNIKEFNLDEIKENLSELDLKYLNQIKNINLVMRDFIWKFEEKRIQFFKQKREFQNKYFNQKENLKKQYLVEKYNLKLDYKQRALKAEYHYNQKYIEEKQKIKEKTKIFKNKIKENQNLILKFQKQNSNYLSNIKQTSYQKIKQIKSEYKKVLKLIKEDINSSHQKDLINIAGDLLNLKNLTNQNLNDKILSLSAQEQHFFKLIKKEVYSLINTYNIRKIIKYYYKGNFLVKKGKCIEKFTYNGKYNLVIGQAYLDYAHDLNTTRIHFLKEKCENIIHKQIFILNNGIKAEKDKINHKKQIAKKNYADTLKSIKIKFQNKQISKQAYKNLKLETKINYRESKNDLKINNQYSKIKNTLNTLFFRRRSEFNIDKKIFESKFNEAQKSIPVECIKNIHIWATFLGFIFPGLPELIWFKQYIKGSLMVATSLLFYLGFIPFALGLYWHKINGIFGLIDLGANIRDIEKGILPDARFYLFGGVVSIILLVFTFMYFLISAIGARRVSIALEHGLRPSKWSATKRWLNTSGFPWMISLFGWVLMIFIVATPVITSILISFTDFGYLHDPVTQKVSWVGLGQWGKWWIFRKNNLLLSMFKVFSWTIVWTIFSSILPIILGMILAILVNNPRLKGKKIFRLIYIIPWAIPVFVTVTFFKNSFVAGDSGYFNFILLKLGILKNSINWLKESANLARVLVILVQTWISYAWIFMLVTGNLQSISKDIYEAASIDGGKGKHLLWFLTIPQLFLMITPMIIGQFVGAFNNFTTISLFTGGGPAYAHATAFGEGTTDIIISWVYKIATGAVKIEGDQAFAAALTTLASLMTIAISARGFIKSMSKKD
ncbi:carbohydrate ABC transporter permease [Mycoplasmopsis cricetuli]|uniref:carbohydrate ABC transporter permease n=1 Tax=Mycoplasmopsis cricetuli TaxID=171283 RepID=UPI00046E9DA9|nr:ABC transporter permease subunit [Mycoplasmopsis cricetuli]